MSLFARDLEHRLVDVARVTRRAVRAMNCVQ
jgi:hypothetical protein